MSQNLLALTVYYWGMELQNRLLVECLGPAFEELVSGGALRRFWFERYDARGPHVFTLLLPHPGGEDEVRRTLDSRLDAFLTRHPSTEELSREMLEQRHAECRGRIQGDADALPGIADNNTYLLLPHSPEGYPYDLSRHLPGHEEIWDLVGDLSRWVIGRLDSESYKPIPEAIRFAMALDREIERAGADPKLYWQYHASTLLPALATRLQTGDPTLLDRLPEILGDANLALFTRFWRRFEPDPIPWQPLPRLLELTLEGALDRDPGSAKEVSWRVQREIDHTLFKQLALPVIQHIPIALFALWRRVDSGGSS